MDVIEKVHNLIEEHNIPIVVIISDSTITSSECDKKYSEIVAKDEVFLYRLIDKIMRQLEDEGIETGRIEHITLGSIDTYTFEVYDDRVLKVYKIVMDVTEEFMKKYNLIDDGEPCIEPIISIEITNEKIDIDVEEINEELKKNGYLRLMLVKM